MVSSGETTIPQRCNVLTLDGGGVRGLSSLLILQDLMKYINATIHDESEGSASTEAVEPQDVFDFAAGTSTGGLIAIMLGKLGMNLKECIQAYHDLSRNIFGKRHLRGRITHGLAPTKYSGTCLERRTKELIESKDFEVNLPMASDVDRDRIACAVVCREHYHQSKYSDIKPGPVPICSLPCHGQVACLVSEAARATSAAPTFFPVQRIGDRYFVDGGMEHNNPSHAIFDHYTELERVAESKRSSGQERVASPAARHGRLDFTRVRIVNLGTGTKSQALPPRQRDRLAQFVPGFIRMSIFLKRTLTEFAVNSENIADQMRIMAWTSTGGRIDFKYHRFSADNGVCYIKMDKYKALSDIEDLTRQYLENPTTQTDLQNLGEEIGRDYIQRHATGMVVKPDAARESVPDSGALSTEAVILQMPGEVGSRSNAGTNPQYLNGYSKAASVNGADEGAAPTIALMKTQISTG